MFYPKPPPSLSIEGVTNILQTFKTQINLHHSWESIYCSKSINDICFAFSLSLKEISKITFILFNNSFWRHKSCKDIESLRLQNIIVNESFTSDGKESALATICLIDNHLRNIREKTNFLPSWVNGTSKVCEREWGVFESCPSPNHAPGKSACIIVGHEEAFLLIDFLSRCLLVFIELIIIILMAFLSPKQKRTRSYVCPKWFIWRPLFFTEKPIKLSFWWSWLRALVRTFTTIIMSVGDKGSPCLRLLVELKIQLLLRYW